MAEKKELTHCIEGSGGRQEGSTTLIKKKEQRGSSIEGEGQKREAVHSTHGQCREAWKTAESCGVTGSGYLKDREDRLSLLRVWVTVGTGPQCCNGTTFGLPIKACIFVL